MGDEARHSRKSPCRRGRPGPYSIAVSPRFLEWHYHPEYELTFTLNSLGQRYIGDHIAPYGDGDLALVGPNLPHTWQSARAIDPDAPHVAIVMWFTQGWVDQVLRPLPEFRATCRMLDASTRGLGFSAKTAAEARTSILALLERDQTAQVIGLIDLLAMLARDDGPDNADRAGSRCIGGG